MSRSTIGIFLFLSFTGLLVTGIALFWVDKKDSFIIFHLLFATVFVWFGFSHVGKNISPLFRHFAIRVRLLLVLLGLVVTIGVMAGDIVMQYFVRSYIQLKGTSAEESQLTIYELHSDPNLEVELRAGEHFWFPQIAVWVEDTVGNYRQTLFVTESTAKGIFFGGRNKENFKDFEAGSQGRLENTFRRVDALPYWSKKRGELAADGFYAPTPGDPVPDAITGATPDGSSRFQTRLDLLRPVKVLVELNVAFDDNAHYSEFDFPDDTLYHSGTGLLGQPSVVYETVIPRDSSKMYQLLEYAGHSHPSRYGPLRRDTEGLTTALEILDLGLLKIDFR